MSAPAPLTRRVLLQTRWETLAMLRNGEQLLLLVVLPLMALVALSWLPLLDGLLAPGQHRLDLVLPGCLALCTVSTAFSGQGIATGFDRRYGVLRSLSTTPLGRAGLVAGKAGAVAAVLGLQFLLMVLAALLLGWDPRLDALIWSVPLLLLGAAAFTGLGLLIAGTARAEATLAVTNLVWVLLAAAGGTLFPVSALPGWAEGLVSLLPSAALGDALRAVYTDAAFPVGTLAVLAVWTVASWAMTARWFKWS